MLFFAREALLNVPLRISKFLIRDEFRKRRKERDKIYRVSSLPDPDFTALIYALCRMGKIS